VTLRRMRRAVALLISIVSCIIRFWLLGLSGPLTLERRALWIQASARHMLKSLGIKSTVKAFHRPMAWWFQITSATSTL
jgi:hypothetical protein